MRSSTMVFAFAVFLPAASVHAQDLTLPAAQPVTAMELAALGETVQQKPPEQKPPEKKDQPPAAVGEEGTKPTRGFASALVHNLEDDFKHMPRRNSLYWLAGGGAAALAVHPADSSINRHLLSGSRLETDLWKPGSYIGEGYVVAPAAVGLYLIGRLDHNPRVTHLGMDEIEGAILAEGFVEAIKVSVRRPRPSPNVGQPITASGYSFPSGHATLTFEAATILQQHLGYRAAIPTYLIATYVAMSRLHDNVHYASDVAFGAGLGIMLGRTVTWHGRNYWGYTLTPSPMVVPRGAGIIIVANAAPHSTPQSDR